jgi:hypothetical protein
MLLDVWAFLTRMGDIHWSRDSDSWEDIKLDRFLRISHEACLYEPN